MNATFTPDDLQLILPAEAKQESSEEAYRIPSDEFHHDPANIQLA